MAARRRSLIQSMLVTAYLLKTLAFELNMIQLHPFDHQLPQSNEPRKTILILPGKHIDFAQVNAMLRQRHL